MAINIYFGGLSMQKNENRVSFPFPTGGNTKDIGNNNVIYTELLQNMIYYGYSAYSLSQCV